MPPFLNHLTGFVCLLTITISVSFDPSSDLDTLESLWNDDSSFLFEGQYNPFQGSNKPVSLSTPSMEPGELGFHEAETFSRPVVIVSRGRSKESSEIRQLRNALASKFAEEEEEDDDEDSSPVIEIKKKKKKVDQPISAYVPTAYIIGNQPEPNQPENQAKEEESGKAQEYRITVAAPKQPTNYAIVNGNYGGSNENMLDKNVLYQQEPQLVEVLQVDGQNDLKELSENDSRDEEAQKSKLTLLFLGYEKF